MRDLFVTTVILGSLPFILKRPFIGVLVWSWIGFMNPHRLTWGFAYDFPFAMVVALTIFLALFISKEPKKIPWTRETVVLALFIFWMFVTTLLALYPGIAWEQWDKVWKIQLMVFITMMLMTTPLRVNLLVWIIALSLGFYGIKGGLFTIATGGAHRVLGPPKSFIENRGDIGTALNMVIPLMRYLQLTATRFWIKHGMTGAMVLTAFAVIGTQSRGAMLGTVALLFFLFLKSRKKFFYTILAAVTAVMIFSFMPQEWHERMHSIENYQEDASAMGRINAWTFAFNLAKDRFTGGGFNTFRGPSFAVYAPNPTDVHDAHSIYFEVLGEHGFVGLTLFLTLALMAWNTASRIRKTAKGNPEISWMGDLAAMIQVSMVAYAVGGSFIGQAYFDLYYVLIALLVACKMMLKRYEEKVRVDSKELAPKHARLAYSAYK